MNCPNCGADVPAGDLFCGECGTRVVPEEKPTLHLPDAAPAVEKERGLPRGLLIGCGGLLALAVIAGCVLGAVTLFGRPEPTPTQMVQVPTDTPVSTPTPTDVPSPTAPPTETPIPIPTATPTQVAPVFELVAFSLDVTDDDQPINPGTNFPAGVTKVYAIFDYSGMIEGTPYDAYWYLDGEEELHKSWEWSLDQEGTSWVNIFNDDGLDSGNYELEIYAADQLLLDGEFTIEASFGGTAGNVRFARDESEDDEPMDIGDVFPFGITEVYVFFDYEGFAGVTEIESTWLRNGEEDVSGTLDWTGRENGTYRIRLYDEEALKAGEYEWQLHVAQEELASGRFIIAEALLFDEFDDPTSGWDEESSSERAQGYRDGAYFINVTTTDWMVWDTPGYNVDDFVFRVDVTQSEGDTGNAYGVLFRYVDSDNFYRFGITGDGLFSLFMQQQDEWITLVDWRQSAHLNPLGELNRLKVVCQGDEITLYANDHELISLTDDSFAQGDIGLFAAAYDVPEVEAVFDDLWVVENR